MKFADYTISDKIKRNLEELGFKKPTDIQFKSIPSIMKGEDVLAIAQTGTGKTAAFAIPIINKFIAHPRHHSNESVRCLVMVPTRELSLQLTEVFQKLAKHTNVSIVSLYGGVEQENQIEKLTRKKIVDVLITTPGRMFDLRSQGFIDLKNTEVLVLDEADQMLALGFNKDIRDVIKYLPKIHQTLFFSATIDDVIKDLAYSIVHNPIRIQISPKDPVSKNVTHQLAFVEMDDKRYFLERLVKEKENVKILVFVRTKVRAERVAKAMERVKIATLTMHGDKTQEDRLSVMKQFKEGSTQVLIATDVSARGIDIPGVQFVVNYDMPDVAENYVHRVGRTGRGTEKGHAISFCATEELDLLKSIENYMGKKITVMEIDKNDYHMTVALSEEPETNWKKLIEDNEKAMAEWRKKNPKKNLKKKRG